jgi:hypothetical protein
MIYILNSLIVPVNFDEDNEAKVTLRRASLEEARALLNDNFISAVGHEGTAQILSGLLGVQIEYRKDRPSIFFRSGDKGLHFFLKKRLPEGVILTSEELKNLDYWLVISEVE